MTDTDSAEPTARPWSAEWTTTRFDWRVVSDDRKTIATLGGPKDINEANAAHIVSCVNSHDELVETLRKCVSYLTSDPEAPRGLTCLGDARAVLAKVGK